MKQVNLSEYNQSYRSEKGATIRFIWFLANALFFLNPLFPISWIKVQILKLFGAKIGEGVVIKPNVNIKYPWLLSLGNNVWVGEGVWIDNLDKVTIDNNVCISQGAMLLTGNHNYKEIGFDLMTGKIHLKEGVWIGAKSVVCPNVIAESHSILTVGSVASKNMNAYSIYKGNPAEFVKERKMN